VIGIVYRLFFLPVAGRDALRGKILKHSSVTVKNFNEIGRKPASRQAGRSIKKQLTYFKTVS
jgi:hypothetical protein